MATRKKAKAKRQKKKPAKRPVARKKVRAVRKTAAKKKPVVRRAVEKKKAKKPAARRAPAPKARPARKPSKPAKPAAAAAAPAPAPAPLVGEKRVGVVTHYYGHLSVAAVKINTASLSVGDTIHVVGHTSDFRQRVESIQLEHESVSEALPDQEIGLKVTEHAREHDVVYKVVA